MTRYLWQLYGFYLGTKNIIFGYGYYGFGDFSGVGTYAHANYIEIICDYGLIGFVIYYGMIISLLRSSLVQKNKDIKIVTVFSIFLLFESFMSVFYYTKQTFLLLGFMFYLINSFKTKKVYVVAEGTKKMEVII